MRQWQLTRINTKERSPLSQLGRLSRTPIIRQAGRQEAGRHPSSVSYEMSDLGGGQKQIIKRSALHFLRKDDPLRDVVV